MSDRGVALSATLTIYSISQVIALVTTYLAGKFVAKSDKISIFIRMSLLIRMIPSVLMLVSDAKEPFVFFYLVYCVFASGIYISVEGLTGRWAYENNVPFGRIRMFSSIGYATNGLIIGTIFSITNNINSLFVIMAIINLAVCLGNFIAPLGESRKTEEEKIGGKMPMKAHAIILVCQLYQPFQGPLAVVLNNHYRSVFGVNVETAMFLTEIVVFLGSCVSEVITFLSIERIIGKLKAQGVTLIAIILSVLRWYLSYFAKGPIMFTTTYLFHRVILYLSILDALHMSRACLVNSMFQRQ